MKKRFTITGIALLLFSNLIIANERDEVTSKIFLPPLTTPSSSDVGSPTLLFPRDADKEILRQREEGTLAEQAKREFSMVQRRKDYEETLRSPTKEIYEAIPLVHEEELPDEAMGARATTSGEVVVEDLEDVFEPRPPHDPWWKNKQTKAETTASVQRFTVVERAFSVEPAFRHLAVAISSPHTPEVKQ